MTLHAELFQPQISPPHQHFSPRVEEEGPYQALWCGALALALGSARCLRQRQGSCDTSGSADSSAGLTPSIACYHNHVAFR